MYGLVNGLKLGREGIEHAVRVTEKLGLCEESRSSVFPFARTIPLTARGPEILQTPVCEISAFLWRETEDAEGSLPEKADGRVVRARVLR